MVLLCTSVYVLPAASVTPVAAVAPAAEATTVIVHPVRVLCTTVDTWELNAVAELVLNSTAASAARSR